MWLFNVNVFKLSDFFIFLKLDDKYYIWVFLFFILFVYILVEYLYKGFYNVVEIVVLYFERMVLIVRELVKLRCE